MEGQQANQRGRPGVDVGEGAVIGAGAIITKSIPAGHIVVGNSAQVTRKMSLDVPDAPGLRYELRNGRMMVLDCCSPPSKLASQCRSELGFPACESRSDEATRIAHGSPNSKLAKSQRSEIDSMQLPVAKDAEQVQWVTPEEETAKGQTRAWVEVAMFLLAVGVAWGVVHAALY